MKIGFITIGQSPRQDVINEIKNILELRIEVMECGVLDGYFPEKIRDIETTEGDIFVTRLRNGRQVKISVKRALMGVRECIKKLEEECHIIVILCTGEFPDIDSNRIVIEPSKLLKNTVYSIISRGKIGVLIPSKEQVGIALEKWKRNKIEPVIEVMSPYEDVNENKIQDLSERFSQAHVDLIVLDCIGYNASLKERIRNITGLPVILPRTLIARTLEELLDL
jgi:protein AroM